MSKKWKNKKKKFIGLAWWDNDLKYKQISNKVVFNSNNKVINMQRENLKMQELAEVEKEEIVEPKTAPLKTYRKRFEKVTAHRLAESSTIHCADGQKLIGEAGDYYVQLDRVQEFMLPEEIFRKLFILDVEK